jgi:hypothetical protein
LGSPESTDRLKIVLRPGNRLDFEDGSLEELATLAAVDPRFQVEIVRPEQRGYAVTWPEVVTFMGDVLDWAGRVALVVQGIRWARSRHARQQAERQSDGERVLTRPKYVSVKMLNGETVLSVVVHADGSIEDQTEADRRRDGLPMLMDAPKFSIDPRKAQRKSAGLRPKRSVKAPPSKGRANKAITAKKR